ncbi:MAG: tetratricopeptide repeat protein, partial [bacterium]
KGGKDRVVELGKLVGVGLGGIAMGLLIFSYLPLSAHSNPIINWGDPSTWGSFWYHVMRKKYTVHDVNLGVMIPYFKLSAEQGIWGRILVGLKSFFAIYWWEFGVLGALALPGAWTLFRKNKSYLAFFAMVFFGVLGFLYISKPDVPGRDIPFFDQLLGFGLLLPLIAIGAQALPKRAGLIILVAPPLLLFSNYKDSNWSNNKVAQYFVEDVFATAPQNSTLLFDGDTIFPVIYATKVEKQRQDLIFYDRTGNINPYAYEVPQSNIVTDSATYASLRFDQEKTILENAPAGVYMVAPPECTQGYFFNGILGVSKEDPAQPKVSFENDYQKMLSIEPCDIANDPYGQLTAASYHLYLGYQTLQKASQETADLARAKTVEEFEKAASFGPQSSSVLNMVAVCYADTGDQEKATQIMEEIYTLNPEYPWVNYNLGLFYSRLKQLDKAAWHLEKTLSLNDTFFLRAGEQLGYVYIGQKKYQEAVDILKKVYDLNPETQNAQLNYGLGLAYLKLKQYAKAVDHLGKTTALQPENTKALEGLAVALFNTKQYEKAESIAQGLLELDPQNKYGLEVIEKVLQIE